MDDSQDPNDFETYGMVEKGKTKSSGITNQMNPPDIT